MKKKFNKFLSSVKQKGLFIISFFLFLFAINDCKALDVTIDNGFDFGTFTQTTSQASFVLSYDSIMTSTSGLTASGTPASARLTLSSIPNGNKVTLQDSHTSSVELTGCTLTFSNIVPSIDDFVMNPGQGKTRTVYYGITVNIDGFCAKGTYSLSGVLIDIHSSKTDDFSDLLPFTIVFNDHIEITQTKEMNFGSFFSPQTSGTVVVSPSGAFNATNIHIYDQGIISAGKFTISGLLNREVQLSFSNATLSNGSATMTADNINADVGSSFVIDSDGFPVNVGGTLHVEPNQAPGHYTGSYTLTVTY